MNNPRIIRGAFVAAACLQLACSAEPVGVAGAGGESLTIAVGQELRITLGNVGPGTYGVPAISSGAVSFVDVAIVPPYLPSGPTQQFRFRGQYPGRALLTFQRSETGAIVVDTVDVH